MIAPKAAIAVSAERELVDDVIDALTCLLAVVDLADSPSGVDDDFHQLARDKARKALRRVLAERPSYPLGRGALS